MRRDLVVQIWADYGSFAENFATVLEAESFISENFEELGAPLACWMEDVHGRRKLDYRIEEDGTGWCRLVAIPRTGPVRLVRETSN